jgi:DNA-binding beta-propeller fold protein YncE
MYSRAPEGKPAEIQGCACGVAHSDETGGGNMRAWGLAAVLLLATWVAGCGGNSTAVGISITGPGLPPLTIIVTRPSVQFTATVTGVSATTVFWQICQPLATPSTTIPPTLCTQGQGPVGCPIPAVKTPITGFGTITANGLYTPPATVPNPASLVIVATSCVRSNAFETFAIILDSGINVQVLPTTAEVGPGENFQFTDIVNGTSDTGVVWMVNTIPGGDATDGYICPSNAVGNPCTPTSSAGEYFAPNASTTVTIDAQSGADPSKVGTATVTVGTGDNPTFSTTDPIEPQVAAEGSAQQDVYLSGTNIFSTTQVLVNNIAVPTADVKVINEDLVRVTIPGSFLTQPGNLPIVLESQEGTKSSGTVNLVIVPVRPVVINSTPNSVQQSNGGTNLTANLVGGYFVPNKTLATFNGLSCGGGGQVCTSYVDSRHLNVSIQDATLTLPGLYPLVVQNSDAVTAGVPNLTGLNLAVNPAATSISSGPGATLSVGNTATPGSTAVAIDFADGYAVIANTKEGSVTIVNMVTDAVVETITTGAAPTGVAIDDMLTPNHLAYVVNSTDNTITTINMSANPPAAVTTVSLAPYEPSVIPVGTVPYTIAANPLTHRAFIANQATNVGTILDLANSNPSIGCAAPPCPVGVVTGGITPYGTGQNPGVAIDPRLNWAMVTPGGEGTISLVDLGRAASVGDVGRQPELMGSLSISATVQGVGINTETHEALLADPVAQTLTTFSLLNDAVTSVTFTFQGVQQSTPGLGSAAVTPLENLGIAISPEGSNGVVADLDSGIILKNIAGLGANPQAVAVDPASNQAIVVDAGDAHASIISLGSPLTQPQILEVSPSTTLTSTSPPKLIVTGANFNASSIVRLDQGQVPLPAPTPSGCVAGVCRQLTLQLPAGALGSARHFLVDVLNSNNGALSNVEDLTVIQPVTVGSGPVAVAIDTDRDLAVVTNMNDNTASLVSLTNDNNGISPESLGDVGVISGGVVSTGATPEGVAVDPRLGVAIVANNGSNNATAIDLTTTPPLAAPQVALCGSDCLNATGVAFNDDTDAAIVTSTNSNNLFTSGEVSLIAVSRTISDGNTSITATVGASLPTDQDPVAVAIDPTLNFAAVATASSTSILDIVDIAAESVVGRVNNLQNPSGVVFDPVNQVFITVNSLLNNIFFTDPSSTDSTTVNVGIAPTSVDYNFQTSSLVTENAGSRTMSVLDYTCPPNAGPTCFIPKVQAVFGLGGTQSSTLVLGPNAVAVDPKLNLAVLVDPDNNRILLVPLPH